MTNHLDLPAASAKPRRRWSMILLSTLLAVLLIGGTIAVLATIGTESSPASVAPADTLPRVTTMTVKKRVMERKLAISGTLVARDEIAIGTALGNQRIREVLVEEGDRVEKGQVMIRLETDILMTQLHDTEARVARATASVAEKEVQRAEAEASFRRTEKLRASGVANQQQYDERQMAFLSADHALKALRAELTQAEAQAEEAQAQLDRAEIRAPEAGIVSERAAQIGAVAGGDPLLKLMRNGEVELAAEVAEADLPAISAGQEVSVMLNGIERRFSGMVRLIAPKVDPRSRLGIVRVALPQDPVIRPGLFAKGELMIERRDVDAIAETAVLYQEPGNRPYVYVVDGDARVARRFVDPGLRRDGYVEIRSGLTPGETVVKGAAAFLDEGDRVTPVKETEPFPS